MLATLLPLQADAVPPGTQAIINSITARKIQSEMKIETNVITSSFQ